MQVIKDPIGSKGARLSTQISIAGRMLVYLPQEKHIGISPVSYTHLDVYKRQYQPCRFFRPGGERGGGCGL